MPVLCVWVYGWLVEIERYGRERDRSIDRRSGLAAVMVCRFEWGGRDGPSSPAALVRYARSANNGANESIHPIGYSHPPTNKQASGFGALLLSSKGDRSTDCWADSINRFIAQKNHEAVSAHEAAKARFGEPSEVTGLEGMGWDRIDGDGDRWVGWSGQTLKGKGRDSPSLDQTRRWDPRVFFSFLCMYSKARARISTHTKNNTYTRAPAPAPSYFTYTGPTPIRVSTSDRIVPTDSSSMTATRHHRGRLDHLTKTSRAGRSAKGAGAAKWPGQRCGLSCVFGCEMGT